MKPRLLVFLGRYLPGFKSGGPVRTISSMVELLAPHYDFFIVTLNSDSGNLKPYSTVITDQWNQVGKAKVFYVSTISLSALRQAVANVKPDVVYLNGYFSASSMKALLLRRFGLLGRVPVVLATRGDLAPGALGLKSLKKRTYIAVASKLGLYNRLLWQASSSREEADTQRLISQNGVADSAIHVAPDLACGYQAIAGERRKRSGHASFVTVSRIARMKNLPFTLDRLKDLRGQVTFDIFGPLEDKVLWAECEQKIRELPPNIVVRYHGSMEPQQVLAELAAREFFILPTLGENYGHVIIDGASAGCPVIISDRTQWRHLAQQGFGWDIPLDDPDQWRTVLQYCIDMDVGDYQRLSARAAEFGRTVMTSSATLQANIGLFERALVRTSPSTPSNAAHAAKVGR
ncbi:MAG TPA: glycosyltransferase family 4 protein [Clostridia bacterium]|nr:glycosyltransferase family 4 protein [Clostridia bacterium]